MSCKPACLRFKELSAWMHCWICARAYGGISAATMIGAVDSRHSFLAVVGSGLLSQQLAGDRMGHSVLLGRTYGYDGNEAHGRRALQ